MDHKSALSRKPAQHIVQDASVPVIFQLVQRIDAAEQRHFLLCTIRGLQGDLKPRQTLTAEITSSDGAKREVPLLCRIDTLDELEYYRNGGILHYVLRRLAA